MSSPTRSTTGRRSLSLRLQLAFLALGLTAILLTGGVSYWIARGALETATYERLTGIRETKKRQLEAYLSDSLAIVAALGRDESAVDGLLGFRATWPPDNADYRAVLDLHDTGLAGVAEALGFEDLLLIDEDGLVVYAANGGRELGADLTADALAPSPLARAFASVLADPSTPRLADYDFYFEGRELAAFAVAAIVDQGRPIGSIAARLSIRQIDEVMTGNGRWRDEGLGDSGETYLVGSDGLMRSDSRFLVEAPESYYAHLEEFGYPAERIERIRSRGTTVLMQPVETSAAARALAGEVATSRILDYRGVPVLSSFTPLGIADVRWALLSEIDAEEAFAPIVALRNRLVLLAIVISAGFVVLGWLFSKRTTEPLLELTHAVERLGDREWSEIGGLAAFDKADDEVARLAQQFDAVSRRLRETTVSRDYLDDVLASMLNAVFTIGRVEPDGDAAAEPIRIRTANPAARQLLGYSKEELEGLPLERVLGRSIGGVPSWLEPLRRDKAVPALEKTLVTRDGRVIPVLFTAAFVEKRLRDAEADVVCVAQDITDSKAAEEQLQALARRLLVAQEEERGRLARELHDDVTQRLGALAIDVGKLVRDQPDSPAAERLLALQERTIRLAHDVQGLSRRLHPSILDDLGLVAALKAETQALRERLELAVSFAAEQLPEEFSREAALALYRTAQECFHNIARHAKATEVNVEVSLRDDQVRLRIEDDGVGFNPAETRRNGGLGLASMEERVRLAGGRLEIESAPGRGVKVTAEVPIQR